MPPHPTQAKLRAYAAQLAVIEHDLDRSPEGRAKLAAQLAAERLAYRKTAAAELSSDWKALRQSYAATEVDLAKAKEKAEAAFDYQRLNYQSQAVRAQLESIATNHNPLSGQSSLAAVQSRYEQALQSHDKHQARAWAEIAPGVIAERFAAADSDAGAAQTLIKRMANDLQALVDSPEQAAARAAGAANAARAGELLEATREVQNVFHPRGVFSASDEFDGLLDGIHFTQSVDDKLRLIQSLEIVEPPATEPAPAAA